MRKILIDEATAKLALYALEDLPGFRADIDNAITALREALAKQPAPRVVDCQATGVCVQSGLRAEQPAHEINMEQQLLNVAGYFYDGPVRNTVVVSACEKAINAIVGKEVFTGRAAALLKEKNT